MKNVEATPLIKPSMITIPILCNMQEAPDNITPPFITPEINYLTPTRPLLYIRLVI